MTRPLGASTADWPGKPHDRGGLGLGDGAVSLLGALAIAALVSYQSQTQRDVVLDPGRRRRRSDTRPRGRSRPNIRGMQAGRTDSPPTRAQSFFTTLLRRDASVRTWLPQLLAATPNGSASLGELAERPGYLATLLAVETVSGLLGALEYPVAPPRELLEWFIDHPNRLTWPEREEMSSETLRLRRALLLDDPPGSQARAQQRARELLAAGPPLSPAWWRFEELARLDCVLITDRLVVTIAGKRTESLEPATEWYPERSELVRNLEGARLLAQDRRWASLVLSDEPLADATGEQLARGIAVAAPHLDPAGRDEVLSAYLGNLTWDRAAAAVGVSGELHAAGSNRTD